MGIVDELKAKQAEIGSLLRLLEDPAAAKFIDQSKVSGYLGGSSCSNGAVSAPAAPAANHVPQSEKRKVKNRGVRSSILRLLLTGPCSMRAINDVIGGKYDRRAITRTLWTLVEEGLARQEQDGYVILPAAIEQAQFLLAHPWLSINRKGVGQGGAK